MVVGGGLMLAGIGLIAGLIFGANLMLYNSSAVAVVPTIKISSPTTSAATPSSAPPSTLRATLTSTLIPIVIAPTIAPLSATPRGGVIATNLPTVTLQAGNGYIFLSKQITSGTGADRDIWWNRIDLEPAPRKSGISLGIINSPSDVNSVSFTPGADVFTPTLGEGFFLRINRGGTVTYAIFRIVALKPSGELTFDYIYPYRGQVR